MSNDQTPPPGSFVISGSNVHDVYSNSPGSGNRGVSVEEIDAILGRAAADPAAAAQIANPSSPIDQRAKVLAKTAGIAIPVALNVLAGIGVTILKQKLGLPG